MTPGDSLHPCLQVTWASTSSMWSQSSSALGSTKGNGAGLWSTPYQRHQVRNLHKGMEGTEGTGASVLHCCLIFPKASPCSAMPFLLPAPVCAGKLQNLLVHTLQLASLVQLVCTSALGKNPDKPYRHMCRTQVHTYTQVHHTSAHAHVYTAHPKYTEMQGTQNRVHRRHT